MFAGSWIIDGNLNLSKIFGISTCQPGVFVVHFVLCILWQLVDVVSDDEGLLELTPEKKAQWPTRSEDVSTFGGTFTKQRTEKIEKLQKMNTVTTVELIEHLLGDKIMLMSMMWLCIRNMEAMLLYIQVAFVMYPRSIFQKNRVERRTAMRSASTSSRGWRDPGDDGMMLTARRRWKTALEDGVACDLESVEDLAGWLMILVAGGEPDHALAAGTAMAAMELTAPWAAVAAAAAMATTAAALDQG